jgi:hypothetical protein
VFSLTDLDDVALDGREFDNDKEQLRANAVVLMTHTSKNF